MKYKDVASFDNHIKKSLPDHVSRAFLVTVANGEDREQLLSSLMKKIVHFFPSIEIWRYDKDLHDTEYVAEKLLSLSLFHAGSLYIFDSMDDMDTTLLEVVKKGIKNCQEGSFFLLGSGAKGKGTALYSELKKELIALDLSEEKPWHRKERLTAELFLHAKRAGKALEPLLAEKILAISEMNLRVMFSILDRCVLFAGKKETLTAGEMESILPPHPEERMWDQAEKLVWSKEILFAEEIDLIPFLGALRYQLQLGLKILSCPNPSPEEFPKVNKTRLAQHIKLAREFGFAYFQQNISYLFELEVDVKNFLDPKKALDLLIFHFQKEKTGAPSFAQLAR